MPIILNTAIAASKTLGHASCADTGRKPAPPR